MTRENKTKKKLTQGSVQRAIWSWQVKHNQKITIEQLAEKSSLAIGTVDRYIHDRVFRPNMDTIRKLAKALEVSIDDLIETVEVDPNRNAPRPALRQTEGHIPVSEAYPV